VTRRLMEGLAVRGYSCLFLLHDPVSGRFVYKDRVVPDIGAFLTEFSVDTLVNQNGYSSAMSMALGQAAWKGRYIVCHHNEPRFLQKLYDAGRLVRELGAPGSSLPTRLGWLVRLLAYPFWRQWSAGKISKTQSVNYDCCSKYVLLSPAFKGDFSKVLGRAAIDKATAIPNPLTFDLAPGEATRFKKNREALIVARLNDPEKRISEALKIWALVEKSDCTDWILKIVGEGPDAVGLGMMAKELGLERVKFLARQDPLPHFRTASLFIMTSRVEGWGLTLTEAMQTGTVPIAFDAYASLRDIVHHGVDGIIVQDRNTSAFASEVVRLMKDPERLRGLALAGIGASERYRIENVLDQWEAIL
jgi:glycosyltransferase involved in cell wall biosynthesis